MTWTESGSQEVDASTVDGIRGKLKRFICSELIRQPTYPLEDDELMITGGLIDSFCLAHLGVFIEVELGVYVPDSDLTVENMDTLGRIVARVLQG
jgi:acyl carrier protein